MVKDEKFLVRLWYQYYRVTHKLKLWQLYWGIDEDYGIPFCESKWFWQNKTGLKGMGYEENNEPGD